MRPQEDQAEPAVDAQWRDEIASRVDDILAGTVNLTTFEETRAKARAILDGSKRGSAPPRVDT